MNIRTALKAVKAAFFNGAKAVIKFIARNLDDLCLLAGIGCLAAGGFILHTVAGLGVLGAGFIAFGIIVAKGGWANAVKKRAD